MPDSRNVPGRQLGGSSGRIDRCATRRKRRCRELRTTVGRIVGGAVVDADYTFAHGQDGLTYLDKDDIVDYEVVAVGGSLFGAHLVGQEESVGERFIGGDYRKEQVNGLAALLRTVKVTVDKPHPICIDVGLDNGSNVGNGKVSSGPKFG